MKANLGLADGVVVSKLMGMYANLIPSDLYQSSEAPAAGSKDRTVKPQVGSTNSKKLTKVSRVDWIKDSAVNLE